MNIKKRKKEYWSDPSSSFGNLKVVYYIKPKKVMKKDNFISLFDHLGKAAGSDLGKQVFEVAKEKNVPFETKQISTNKYTGKILIYPKEFLDAYFNGNVESYTFTPKSSSDVDDLPF